MIGLLAIAMMMASASPVAELIWVKTRDSEPLHAIVRRLGKTPASLLGETDHRNAHAPPVLTDDERMLLSAFRTLPPQDKTALIRVVESMNGLAAAPERHWLRPDYLPPEESA